MYRYSPFVGELPAKHIVKHIEHMHPLLTKHIEPPSSIRFAAAAVVVVLACSSLLSHSLLGAMVCFGVNIFLVPRPIPDLSDSAMRRWLWGVGIRLAVLLVVVGIVYFRPLLTADTAQRVLFHPAFVVPFALLELWSLFRGWRRQRGVFGA
jgi:hypothetical protein